MVPTRHVGVDVRRAVERIDGDEQRCARVEREGGIELFRRHRCDRRFTERGEQHVVGADVELLLCIAGTVLAADGTERSGQRTGGDEIGDRAARASERDERGGDDDSLGILARPEGKMLFEGNAAVAHTRSPLFTGKKSPAALFGRCFVSGRQRRDFACLPQFVVKTLLARMSPGLESDQIVDADGAFPLHESQCLPQARPVKGIAQ